MSDVECHELDPGSPPVDALTLLALITILAVLAFDCSNGFHDASNIIATVIASRAMSPARAVLIVGFFHLVGPVMGGTAVANTIGKFVELSDVPRLQAMEIVFSGVIGASAWNLLTWWKGLPSSSSHALVGGLIGAVVASAGGRHVVWGFEALLHGHVTGVTKVLLALLLSPVVGFVIGFLIQRFMVRMLRRAKPGVTRYLRGAQYLTVMGLSFSHGANDAQKSMGILTLVMMLGGWLDTFTVPFWIVLSCAIALTIGVMMGGWRIVRTLGFSIFRVRPLHALDSQLTAAAVIFGASVMGAPVSTTHVVTTAIMGVGAADRPRAVRWGKAMEIAWTWVITIPGSALLAIFTGALVRATVGIFN
jgi:inorganic phosphate transporter, PiT family